MSIIVDVQYNSSEGVFFMADGDSINRILLKKILYRVDFQFITEKVQEEVYSFISESYGDNFAEQSQELASEFDFEINTSTPEQSRLNKKSQPVFIFTQPKTDDCDGRVLKLGRTFFYLELELKQSTMGIPYFDWVAAVIKKLETYPIFRITRIGLRKFNSFFILDEFKENLKDIFQIDYLSNAECAGFDLDSFSNSQVYINTGYQLRFTRNYSSGNLSNAALKIEQKPAHLVAFDFDLYSSEDEILALLTKNQSKELQDMNTKIYSFFNTIVKRDIIERLNKGDDLSEYHIIPY